ncbi:hypothetical protein QCA50_011360 [Cerrena zonata]|uniref:Uncharacterized protein n=1 Tax=Cerrena zonata TaxID=2478898 RepID=A0AAW0FX95_9APHY
MHRHSASAQKVFSLDHHHPQDGDVRLTRQFLTKSLDVSRGWCSLYFYNKSSAEGSRSCIISHHSLPSRWLWIPQRSSTTRPILTGRTSSKGQAKTKQQWYLVA